MKTNSTTTAYYLLLGTITLLTSCGDIASDDSTDSWSAVHASGFAIVSPTATSASRRFSTMTALTGEETLEEKTEMIDAIADGSGATGCNVVLPSFNGFSARATCYGPSVNYANHPDPGGGSGALPTGDLGIWEATESGEACASRQLTTIIGASAMYVDTALLFEASAICLLNEAGLALPALGETVDFTSNFETSLQANNPSATVSSATASMPFEGVYQYDFVGETSTGKPFTVTYKIKKSSDEEFQGRVYGYFSSATKDAFGVTFSRFFNDVTAQMLSASWVLATEDSSILSPEGNLVIDGMFSGNMNQAIINSNLETLATNVSYGWQAGPGDTNTRIFNVFTTTSEGLVSGCGYFGFGDAFDPTYANNTNAIDGFICNWAGPGNDHSMVGTAGLGQKQCFDQVGSVMQEVVPKTAIYYAPTNDCNDSDGAFTYDWPTGSGDGATHALIDVAMDADYASYSSPLPPTLDPEM